MAIVLSSFMKFSSTTLTPELFTLDHYQTIFTLPEGYRPAGDAHFGTVTVEADGDVTAPGDVSLDGIAFRVG